MKRYIMSIICVLSATLITVNAQVIHRTTNGNTVSAAITTKTVTKQKKVHPEYLRPLGFRQMTEVNLGFTNWGVDYIAGYKFNQYFLLGAGLGLEAISPNHHLYNSKTFELKPVALDVPIYLNAKGYFTKTRFQPYVDLSFGGHIGNAKGLSGLLFDIGPGVNLYINEKFSVYTSVKICLATSADISGHTPLYGEPYWSENGRTTNLTAQFHIGFEF